MTSEAATRLTASSWPTLSEVARDVLLEVLIHSPLSRAEIAARLRLSRPTLTRVTRSLVAQGLLVEGDTRPRASAGRPSEMLHVRGAAHRFLGVKLTAERLFATVTDLTATPVATAEEPLRCTDPDGVVAQIAAVARRFPGITGIGVTLGGIVLDGVVARDEFLRWTDVPLKAAVTGATRVPTAVDNDVQALTAAEHWFGPGAGLRSLAVITVGAGVGTGLVVGGTLVAGSHGLPPHFSHTLVDANGPQCGCGRRGCISSYLMTHVLLRRLTGHPGYEEALDRVRAGDPQARQVFDEAGYALGVLIGTVANVIDPQKVLLTGDGLPLYEASAPLVHDGIEDTYEDDPDLIELDVRPFGFSEWARSGAALAIKETITGAITGQRDGDRRR
ncbi:ROK family transcriptional regulator [Saccharothrix texasensis]|uniref:Putative NBD/HSP70 family sugar kinase n=1 Tax=Saccharothrix texasensis TaxID=103734 RepID=A0A3N1H0D1_9PSEU|nr:ROK family transcriptional regulator [Saccharothrix texasensis]ROP35944.1 putative NBD/HSP70 family sugar kinase [Saccharothrix texasensis]